MHLVIGWIIGRESARALGNVNDQNNNALWGILLWLMIPGLAAGAGYANFGEWAAVPAAALSVVITLAFVCRRPLESGFKSMMLAAIEFVSTIAAGFAAIGLVILVLGPIVFGDLKEHGLQAFNLAAIGNAALATVVGGSAAAFVDVVLQRDRRRLEADAVAGEMAA